MKQTYRKSWAGDHVMLSDLTLDPSFKVKRGQPNLKVPLNRADVFRFDLWPLLQGQTRIAKLKSVYNSLIIGLRGLQCETNL